MSRDLEINSLSAIEHLLSHCPQTVRHLWIQSENSRTRSLEKLARAARIPVEFTRGKKKEGEDAARATIAPFQYADLKEWLIGVSTRPRALVLALDHLQDPQNFGALCRTAEGLGLQGVILPKDRSVAVTPGVYSASVGAVATLPIISVGSLSESLRKLKDEKFWIVGTTLGEGSTDLREMPDFEKIVLVLGAEWEGLSAGVEKMCDWRLHIPLAGKVQSLNVSAAGAILMYALQQRANSLATPVSKQ